MKKIGRILAYVLGGFLILGFFLPGKTKVERSLVIQATPKTLFEQAYFFENWRNWSPWFARDTQAAIQISPPFARGLGATYTWDSAKKELGKGQITVLDTLSHEKIQYQILLDNRTEIGAQFKLKAQDSLKTQATWLLEMDHGLSPISRWFGLIAPYFIAPDYEQSLQNLAKTTAEK
jgi:hypothetical protein